MIKTICASDGVLNCFDPYNWYAMNGKEQGLLKIKMNIDIANSANDNKKHILYDECTMLSKKLNMHWGFRLFSGITHNDMHISQTFFWWMKFTERAKEEEVFFNIKTIKVVE